MSQVSAHCCAPAARLAFHVMAGELCGEGAFFGGGEGGQYCDRLALLGTTCQTC